MKKKRLFGRNMSDSAFSIERLFIWAVGLTLLVGATGMVLIGYQGRTIPPQIQSMVMVCLGAFVARIERRK